MSVNCVNENGEAEFLENNCVECAELDDINMVQCDECDQWAHFRCVGVGPEIEDSDWCCRLCNTTLSGLSLTDTNIVDASVGTESEPPLRSSVDTDAKNNVASSVGTEAQSLNVNSPSVDTNAQASDGSSVGTEVQPLNVNYVDSSVGTESQRPFHSSVGTNAQTNDGSSVDKEVQPSVNSNVHTLAKPSENSCCLKLVKEDADLPCAHLQLDDKTTFEFYKGKLAKFGGSDMRETVREIGQKLIADQVLMKYSYLGRRKKFRFKDFDNLTKLVVASTIASMKRRHIEIHEKVMEQSDEEAKLLYKDVEEYFTTEYIKKAEVRYKRSLK